MINWTHCVFAQHDYSDKKYIFCVDDTEKLIKRVVGTVELQPSVTHIIRRFDELPF